MWTYQSRHRPHLAVIQPGLVLAIARHTALVMAALAICVGTAASPA